MTAEYRGSGEWCLVLRSLQPRLAGEFSVTAENRLGSSTRDWQLEVRPPPRPTPDPSLMAVWTVNFGQALFTLGSCYQTLSKAPEQDLEALHFGKLLPNLEQGS